MVATTRVETMLGDTAIAVHPDDERYRHLVGRTVLLPIVNREIPVVADDHVDPQFGTGAVKVTPAHDPNDFEIGRRHGLPAPTILDEAAGSPAPERVSTGWTGSRRGSRSRQELRAQGRIVAEKIPYMHAVGHCSRSDDVIEPRLSTQWFVKVEPLAKAAGDAVRDGRTEDPPAGTGRPVLRLGRQHARLVHLPAAVVGSPDPGLVRPGRRDAVASGPDEEPPGEGWTQDPDVLDTWFSSGLWPFSTMGWPRADRHAARRSTRRPCWSPATTSCSSGSSG